MAHHRLFVAIRPPRPARAAPPRPARAAMLAAMGGVAAARWQDDEQLHCTLRFVGEVDGRTAEDVATALLGLRHPGFDVASEGWGSFARGTAIDTLWLGLGPAATLRALHAKVDRLLVGAGIAPDRRAYRPHVTLARFARSAAPDPRLVERVPPPAPITFRVEEVRLYESLLGRDGARYEPIARYPIG